MFGHALADCTVNSAPALNSWLIKNETPSLPTLAAVPRTVHTSREPCLRHAYAVTKE